MAAVGDVDGRHVNDCGLLNTEKVLQYVWLKFPSDTVLHDVMGVGFSAVETRGILSL